MKLLKRVLKWITGAILVLLLLAFLMGFIAYWRSTNDCGKAGAPTNPMKAIVYCDYGVANLKLEEIEKPAPSDDQILVRVRAASINPYDWHFVEGTPYVMRAMGVGLRKPKDTRLGVDFAGTVEAVGKNVTQFKPGDEVFGGRGGAFAQYVCPRATRAVALKPGNVSFEDAASVNIAGITALQAVRDKGKVQPGQKVLINGASGGVGTFAVQIAKSLGADVTGVCSTRNVDLVKSLGADHVIDYTKEDFSKRRGTLRRDARQCGKSFAVGVQGRPDSHRQIRPHWRRRSKRSRLSGRTRQSALGDGILKIRQPADGHDDGRRESKGSDCSGGYDAVREAETGDRPHLQIRTSARRNSLCGTRPRQRKSGHYCRLIARV